MRLDPPGASTRKRTRPEMTTPSNSRLSSVLRPFWDFSQSGLSPTAPFQLKPRDWSWIQFPRHQRVWNSFAHLLPRPSALLSLPTPHFSFLAPLDRPPDISTSTLHTTMGKPERSAASRYHRRQRMAKSKHNGGSEAPLTDIRKFTISQPVPSPLPPLPDSLRPPPSPRPPPLGEAAPRDPLYVPPNATRPVFSFAAATASSQLRSESRNLVTPPDL